MEGVEIEFREDALHLVAKRSMQRKSGARGLRSILENVLLNTMYELPSMINVNKVLVDVSVIEGKSDPILIFTNQSQPQSMINSDITKRG